MACVVRSCCATSHLSERYGKIQPNTKSISLNRSTKKSAQLITSARGPPIPNLVEIRSLEASGQMGEI